MSTDVSISASEIKSIREKLGLSQAELADRLNLSRAAIAQWETDRCSPTGAAEVLLRQLVALAESQPPPTPAEPPTPAAP